MGNGTYRDSAGREADVAVIGAAGQTGRPLVRELSRRGVRVRALVHHPISAADLGADDARAVGLDDVAGLTDALAGVGAVHYIPPVFTPHEEAFGRNVVAAAEAAGVPRLVYHSVMRSATPAMPHHWRKSLVEHMIRDSALAWTVLQPAMYAQTVLSFLDPRRWVLQLGFDPDRPFTPVDVHDLAEVAARVLTEDGHAFATYELAGPERLSIREMATVMSSVLGRTVGVRRLPATIVAAVGSRRLGEHSFRSLKAMLDHYDAEGFVGSSAALLRLLGRDATPFADVVARDCRTA